MNKASITVVGKVFGDPQQSTTKNGKTMLKFTVRCSPGVKDMEDKWVTNFYNIAVFDKFAENIIPHVHKDDMVVVIGTLAASAYMRKDGNPGVDLKIQNISEITTPTMMEYRGPKKQTEDEDDLPV